MLGASDSRDGIEDSTLGRRRVLLRKKRLRQLESAEQRLYEGQQRAGIGERVLDLTPPQLHQTQDSETASVSSTHFPKFVQSYFCCQDLSQAPGIFDSKAARRRRQSAYPVEFPDASRAWTSREVKALRNVVKVLMKKCDSTSNLRWDFVKFLKEGRVLRGRSPAACRAEWEERRSPTAPAKRTWSPELDKRLVEAVTANGGRNWLAISTIVGDGRTPFACFARYQSKFRPKTKRSSRWTKEEDDLLLQAVESCGSGDWIHVASMFQGQRSNKQCSERWRLLVQGEGQTQDVWTVDENRTLTLSVAAFGENDWASVAACVPNRTSTECSRHWRKISDEKLCKAVGPKKWSRADDERLRRSVKDLGSSKWAAVAEKVFGPGRLGAANICRRRWISLNRGEAREAKRKKELEKELIVKNRKKKRKKNPRSEYAPSEVNLSDVVTATKRGLRAAAAATTNPSSSISNN